jgi:hypothetical protein
VEGEADVGLGGFGGGRAGSFACRVGCGRHGGARLGSRDVFSSSFKSGRGALDLMFPATKYLIDFSRHTHGGTLKMAFPRKKLPQHFSTRRPPLDFCTQKTM